MKETGTPPRSGDALFVQQRRIDELKRGIDDLRHVVTILKANTAADQQLLGEAEPSPPPTPAPGLPVADEARGGRVISFPSDPVQAPVAPKPATIEPSDAELTPVLHKFSTIQRAVERLKNQVNTQGSADQRSSLLGSSVELREYWKIIRKRLWLIVLLMIIGGSVTGYYSYQQPPQYRSTTTLYLNPAAANSLLAYQSYDTLDSLAQTYAEFLKTQSFANHVAESLPLDTGRIIGALSTQYVANTQFFRITATDTDPQVAQQLANTAAKVLIDQNIARQQAEQDQIKSQSDPDPERDRLIEVRSNLQQALDLYSSQISTVQTKLDDFQRQPQSDANVKEILNLQNQLVNLRASHLSALNGLADTQAALASTESSAAPNVDTAVVIDAAPLPSGALPNKTLQNVLIALLASLSIGAAIAFLLEYLDYTIKTPQALEAIYGAAAQGVIGIAGGKRGKEQSSTSLVMLSAPNSPMAESFRALRTGVGVAGLIAPMHSLLITSASPGEGKTFVAANLAISLAQNGSRVILVDADLRRPRLHYLFDVAQQPGLSNLVVDQQDSIEDCLQPTNVENLLVLACGIIPPNPAELLGSPRAAEVMEQLAQHADIVIYDSPPAATVIDAVVIGSRVDAALHVVHAGSTRIDLVRRCKALLERGGAHILGPVLNQVALPELQSYSYAYAYSYSQDGKNGKGGKADKPAKRFGLWSDRAPQRRVAPSAAKIASNGVARSK